MAADFLISSLQPLNLDGVAPISPARFLEACRDQLGERHAQSIAALLAGSASARPTDLEREWLDLDAQLRNAAAAERARLRGVDPAKWRHAVEGCSLFWAARVQAAFQEKNPAKRDRLLDQVRWDAAGELTPAAGPLSVAAAYTYALRLAIVVRRQALSSESGNQVFDDLTAATKLEF